MPKPRKSCSPSLPNILLKMDISYIKVLDPSTVVLYCDFNGGSPPRSSQVTFGSYFSTWVYTCNLFLVEP